MGCSTLNLGVKVKGRRVAAGGEADLTFFCLTGCATLRPFTLGGEEVDIAETMRKTGLNGAKGRRLGSYIYMVLSKEVFTGGRTGEGWVKGRARPFTYPSPPKFKVVFYGCVGLAGGPGGDGSGAVPGDRRAGSGGL
jgi:hypothetical protein